jgi:hypothetical protein
MSLGGGPVTAVVRPEVVLIVRQSGFGIGSCLTFAGALGLGCAALVIVEYLKPTRPINHMDFSAALIPLMTAIGFAVLISILHIVGLALGIIGLRHVSPVRWPAQLGTVLNGGGLVCMVILIAILVTRL